ncbi:C-glycoside deglycosidase beta subunit domain-containing protein [Nitrospirillum viridazoti]|uniref:C-deglycosylation enzyme beta subunit n=1 Tax=Nitrospirillum viridazoti CBAmc TaxID=1441467 RepID=A0A248JNI9_9PROT|nr:DUF6379 domain-containing protein [Nitrospirillum amazonense]ASG20277.1 hypothetical protein Y958_05170 [Nitrospirillum amazonense CBAmc]TWB27963.1 hypothetical protein FBZ91_13120 [Nitrospirillum amazonense]
MFDKYMICEEGFGNVVEDGQVVGFTFLARLPYYRGIGLSMVEDIGVVIDGEPVSRQDVRFTVRGRTWTLDEMETEYTERWNFGEKAAVTVRRPNGLAPGRHRLQLSERIRVSYLPFVPTTRDAKELDIPA